MELQPESESAAVSPSLLAAIETRADKAVSFRFDIGMRDFVEDAAFLRDQPSLSLKRKRASTDLPAPSSSNHSKRDMALQPIQLNTESRFLLLAIFSNCSLIPIHATVVM